MRAKYLVPAAFLLGTFLFLPGRIHAENWVNIGLNSSSPTIAAADIGNKDHLLVATQPSGGSEIDYTYDGGKTWSKATLTGSYCTSIKQNPKFRTEWWAACTGGLFRSVDDGKNFSRIPNFVDSNIQISIANDGEIYLAIANTSYRSADGLIWEKGGFANTVSSNVYIAADPTNSNVAYVSRTGNSAGLYKTSDGGKSWALISNKWEFQSGIASMFVLKDGTLCALYNTEGVSYSSNGGMTWTAFQSPDPILKVEPSRVYSAVQNPDDLDNVLIANVGMNDSTPRLYSTEGTDTTKTKMYSLSWPKRGMAISQGIIFACVGTPLVSAGVWSSDGIAVKPEYLTKYPIIIVPGILGSWNVPYQGWKLDPIFGTYDGLINNLTNAGYEPGKTLFAFPYEWRNDNRVSAELLKQRIAEVKAISGSSKVDIIAHSMGGLVTRFYAEGDDYQNDINRIFFLGTPQLGSVDSYFLWEGATTDFMEYPVSVALDFILREEAAGKGYLGNFGKWQYIHNYVGSVGQLLPIFDYKAGSKPSNQPLSDLKEKIVRISSSNIKVINIVGSGENSTTSWVNTVGSEDPFLWIDGEPSGLTSGNIWDGITRDVGDGTVLNNSSTAVPGTNYQLAGVSHQQIPNNAADVIFKELGINKQALVTEAINKYLMIKAYSPVNFNVTSPSGKKVGFNQDGSNFTELLGAFYSGADSSAQFVMIPNPESGQYSISTVGTGTGEYKIESTFIDEGKQIENTNAYSGLTSPGSEQMISTNLDAEDATLSEKINDENPPASTSSIIGGVKSFYTGDVGVVLLATDDVSGVKSTEYSNDGITWNTYSSQIAVSNEGDNTLYFRSTDFAGNEEATQHLDIVIDRIAPTMSVSLNKSSFTKWESMKVACSVSDAVSGVKTATLEINGQVLPCQNQTIALSGQTLGTRLIKYTAMDNAGNVVRGTISYSVIATFASSQLDLASLYSKHQITISQYLKYSVWLSLTDIYDKLHITKLRNSTFDLVLQQLELEKRLKKIDENAYNLIKEDVLWLRK